MLDDTTVTAAMLTEPHRWGTSNEHTRGHSTSPITASSSPPQGIPEVEISLDGLPTNCSPSLNAKRS